MERKRTNSELLFDGDLTAWNNLYTQHFRRFYEMFNKLPFTRAQAKDIIHEAIEKIRCEAQPRTRAYMYVCDVRREIGILIHIAMDKVRIKHRNEKRMKRYYGGMDKYGNLIQLSIPAPLSVRKKFNWDKKLSNRIKYMKDELDLNYYQISRALKLKEKQVEDIYIH